MQSYLDENEYILKKAEALSVYSSGLMNATSEEERASYLEALKRIVSDLKKLRIHYRKNQMILFPYLERRGINAIPRVLWGKEDQAIVKIRELEKLLNAGSEQKDGSKIASLSLEISREIADLVFRENKILYPTLLSLLSEGEWAAIMSLSDELGYIVPKREAIWKRNSEPVLPYQIEGHLDKKELEQLPAEVRNLVESAVPEEYSIKEEGKDIELATGFLIKEQLEGIYESILLELTFADSNDRIKFFSKSKLMGGFPRSRSIIGRRLE